MTLTTTCLNKALSICDQCDIPLTALGPRAPICPVNGAESVHTARGGNGSSRCSPIPLLSLGFESCVYWVQNGAPLTALSISVMWSILAHHAPLLWRDIDRQWHCLHSLSQLICLCPIFAISHKILKYSFDVILEHYCFVFGAIISIRKMFSTFFGLFDYFLLG